MALLLALVWRLSTHRLADRAVPAARAGDALGREEPAEESLSTERRELPDPLAATSADIMIVDREIHGVIQLVGGEALPDLRINVVQLPEGVFDGVVIGQGTTDSDGRFRIRLGSATPHTRYRVVQTSSPRLGQDERDFTLDSVPLRVVLPGCRLHVEVADCFGALAVGAIVRLAMPDSAGRFHPDQYSLVSQTDDNGQARFDLVNPGAVLVWATSPDGRRRSDPLEWQVSPRAPRSVARVSLRDVDGCQLSVRVTGNNGRSVEYVSVQVLPLAGGGPPRVMQGPPSEQPLVFHDLPSGRYRVKLLPALALYPTLYQPGDTREVVLNGPEQLYEIQFEVELQGGLALRFDREVADELVSLYLRCDTVDSDWTLQDSVISPATTGVQVSSVFKPTGDHVVGPLRGGHYDVKLQGVDSGRVRWLRESVPVLSGQSTDLRIRLE